MKPLLPRAAVGQALQRGVPVAMILVLSAALTVRAATSYTATGWVVGVPLPGLWCNNAQGQVSFRGNAHLARVQSADARLTGRRTLFLDAGVQTDGSALVYGQAYQEVGTWDATGTNFTPTGGTWETSYRGTMGAEGSLNLHLVGCGWGGTIDGLRLEETLTRANGPFLDPGIPYQCAGTIKPSPLNTNMLVDDFSGPAMNWSYWGSGTFTRSDGQLVVRGHWPGMVTHTIYDSFAIGAKMHAPWTAADGQTLEVQVDLVNRTPSSTMAQLAMGTTTGFYALWKGDGFVVLWKYSASASDAVMFFYEDAALPDSDVILSLAVTKTNANAVVTARVLDKNNRNSVLYARSVVDTPGADPTLTSAELADVSGMSLVSSSDPPEAPFTSGGGVVGLEQYNDGDDPPAVAIFDNLELRLYDVPEFTIQRAVRLSWPTPVGASYGVEAAPTVLGPWLPVQVSPPPSMQQMTVPASEASRVFRLIQAP